jgi:hypothetical protein
MITTYAAQCQMAPSISTHALRPKRLCNFFPRSVKDNRIQAVQLLPVIGPMMHLTNSAIGPLEHAREMSSVTVSRKGDRQVVDLPYAGVATMTDAPGVDSAGGKDGAGELTF